MFQGLQDLWDRLFGEKEEETESLRPIKGDIETAPLTEAQLQRITQQGARLEPAQFITASGLSVGRERDHNEDSLFTFNAVLSGENARLALGVFIIADGLGGHDKGAQASQVAARAMGNHLLKRFYLPFFDSTVQSPQESIQEVLLGGVTLADEAVKSEAAGGGTTLTAMLVLGNRMTLAHVGDSRAYEIPPVGEMKLLTRDHSFAHRLEELGQITPEEAENHPQRHDLYRALGLEVVAEPEIFTNKSPPAGHLLLCSDGLWGVVPDADIARMVRSAPNLHQAVLDLIEAANAAGGPDNISVILVQLPD